MPIPETAPGLVGPFGYPASQNINGNPGPYKLSGNHWIFTTSTDGSLANGPTVYKSTDGGVNYGVPITDAITVFGKNCCAVSWDGSNTQPIFAYLDASDELFKFVPFNTAVLGGTYQGGRNSGLGPSGGGAAVGNVWCVNYGLKVYIGWDDATGPHILYYDGSSFSAIVDIPAAGTQILPMSAASGSKCGVWTCDPAARGDAGAGSFFYTIFNGATLVSTSTALTLPSGDNRVFDRYQISAYYDPGSDSSVLPLPMFLHSDATGFHALLVATPSGLAPAFTLQGVTTFNATDDTGYPFMTGGYALFWQRTRASDSEHLAEFSTCGTVIGTWGTATLFYDQEAHQPSPTPSANGMFPVTANLIASDGTTGVIVGMTEDLTSPSNTFDTVLFTWRPLALSSPTTLRLLKRVVGGVSAPFEFTLNADGPMSISGNGDTGVTPVTPGIYALSESAGPFGYTPGTYSCVINGGAPVSADSVTIATNDVVVCTITNTFNGVNPFPPACVIYTPTTPTPSLIAYDEPLELQGS